ncbi:hypothetical protein BBJ28_00020549 [Nothophytophthora sp. Chile5]|nr:hypothetical protein BBJ28_00020549 [Nothophytophthora sp. Chile5]
MSPGFAELRTPKPDDQVTAKAKVDHVDDPLPFSAPPSLALVSLRELFTFADRWDRILMVVGTLGALLAGLATPIQIVLVGNVMNVFSPYDPPDAATLRSNVNTVALKFVLVGIGMIVCGFLQVACWSLTASRQAKRFRVAYITAIVTKEIAWFDVNEPTQLAAKVADSTVTIQEGMGRKIGDGLHFFSMCFCGIVIGLTKGWQLALLLVAFTPLLAVTAFFSMKFMAAATQDGIESYGKAGAIAQEALGNARTVHMFNAISYFVEKYATALESSTKAGIRKGLAIGWGIGAIFFMIYCTYSGGMYFAAYKISKDQLDRDNICTGHGCYDGGKVTTIFFAIIMGAMALGQAGPCIQAVYAARACAADVFAVIRRPSLIDPMDESGRTLPSVLGKVTLANVTFAYPSRPQVNVFNDYSLTISSGETVALVGASGSGKSTIVSLLERFYDPLSGSVEIDDVDLRELNVKWLRDQIGLVGQEPVLFAASILENIRYGCPTASDDQVYEAATLANAYDFIQEFPAQFETEVGERGTQLSGGQKQRIAIARAIIKNPSILILDEATSALDTESERVVQESLDSLVATRKRTTIIVAHRLSTIQGADRIVVHQEGAIIESGTHDDLMQIEHGRYKHLVETQSHSRYDDRNALSTRDAFDEADRFDVPKRKRSSLSRHDNQTGEDLSEFEDTEAANLSKKKAPVTRIWQMSRPEWKYLAVGSLGAIGNAIVFPAWGFILAKIIMLLFDYSKTPSQMLTDARYWSIAFVALGVFFGVAITVQHYCFAVAAQRLVARVRLATFNAMLQQEIGWFDLEENASGALVARLSTDSAMLQAITAQTLNQGLVNCSSLAVGLGIAFYYSWQMSLVTMAVLPVLLLFSYVQSQQVSGNLNNRETNAADAAAGSLLSEAIESIRTVAAFSMERQIKELYAEYLEASKLVDIKVGAVGGLMFGCSQGVMFMVVAFLFYIGAKWAAEGTIVFKDMFVVWMVIILSTFAVGMAAQDMTDGTKAKVAAANVFKIIDRVPMINSTEAAGGIPSLGNAELEFSNVAFSYPARPDAKVYRRYNLKVGHGQTVALVGASGSGKSTAIALLERFYDPSSGVITFDGRDIRELNLPWLRERISLVSQEPVLFAGTIADNIALGKLGATRDEVVAAAKKANAYNFISHFPDGFDTDVGGRGVQVSGGQKQRIAIARAIIRDPEVLLLDEATSALDAESERVVQASLDDLLTMKRRTTIIVAHRLSTIRDADLIAVTEDGAIVEQGTHDALMQIPNGIYKALVARQVTGEA